MVTLTCLVDLDGILLVARHIVSEKVMVRRNTIAALLSVTLSYLHLTVVNILCVRQGSLTNTGLRECDKTRNHRNRICPYRIYLMSQDTVDRLSMGILSQTKWTMKDVSLFIQVCIWSL